MKVEVFCGCIIDTENAQNIEEWCEYHKEKHRLEHDTDNLYIDRIGFSDSGESLLSGRS